MRGIRDIPCSQVKDCVKISRKARTFGFQTIAASASTLFVFCFLAFVTEMNANAQHVEVGGFGNYSDLNIPTFPSNGLGVGARASIGIHRLLQLEVEGAYDIKHSQFAFARSVSSFTVVESKIGVVHANGGLKLQTPGGSYFVFLKGGANWYDPGRNITTVTGPSITSSTSAISLNTFTRGVLYPGAGIGFHAGPLGIRLDVGDEMSWDNGFQNSLRVTFGPTLRF